MKHDAILVLDFGGQYCNLIARRVRELKVYSEIVPCDMTAEEIKQLNTTMTVKGLILSGGPWSVYEEDAPKFDPKILELGIPILGLCYGHQMIAYYSKGKVKPGTKKEYGIAHVMVDKAVGVLKGLDSKEKVWMSHGDTVYGLPEEFEMLAYTESCPIAAFRHKTNSIYGLQWHPEVVHTENGMQMLRNFVFEVCKCEPNWKPESVVDKAIKEIKEIVGNGTAIIGLSGGIDSSVATFMAAKALGERLLAIYVDHGFMRLGETEYVESTFKNLGVNIIAIHAQDRFMKRLEGVIDPEEKRKIIGEEFIRVFEEAARKIAADYLIQGTIYPDRIESGFRKHSDTIKTHHNVGGLPEDIEFKKIIEPLRDLYKDEVREVAKIMGLPNELVTRQPFPGPGLAVRIIGELTKEKTDLLRKADKIVTDEIENVGLGDCLWQYFAVLTETKSTGVKGDSRAYGFTIAVRIVESKEAMTAGFARIPYDVLEKISTRITNELPQVTRVVYDITHKPPATIEWE
ncbi:MAG: glutamine-hydrolyzing GMP synthase [Candidatus Bathyarchaeota archaeon]|nr:glutamine-hydrolyzing GMP synthase [Candidatus Bathyarchaeota archaeon]